MAQTVDESQILAAVLAYQQSKLDRDAETVLRLADPLIYGRVVRGAPASNFDLADVTNRVRLKISRGAALL
jgi:hypothetical protein